MFWYVWIPYMARENSKYTRPFNELESNDENALPSECFNARLFRIDMYASKLIGTPWILSNTNGATNNNNGRIREISGDRKLATVQNPINVEFSLTNLTCSISM